MDEFLLYTKMGVNHVLDFAAYDHILFLVVLAVVFSFNSLKKLFWLVSLFTLGHTFTLALSAYGVLKIPIDIVEFLIPVTILITALCNIFKLKSSSANNMNLFFAGFFGLVHGLGFSNYFRMMVGEQEDKLLPLLEFALGIEIAQVIIVVAFLFLAVLVQGFFRVSKRDWVLAISSVIIGFVIPMIVERIFW